MKPLKIGFLVDELEVSPTVFELIEHVKESDLFLNPVIIHGYSEKRRKSKYEKVATVFKKHGFLGLLNRLAFSSLIRFIRAIERIHVQKSSQKFGERCSLQKISGVVQIAVNGNWSQSLLFLNFDHDEINKIRSQNFDCIIRCGSGILRGEILNTPRLGLLSFHHGDNAVNRGGPCGFWEVFKSEAHSGFVIQKLNNELDGGEVLFRGNIMTRETWTSNEAALIQKSNFFMKNLLNQIALSGKISRSDVPVLHNNQLYKLENTSTLLLYTAKILLPKVINKAMDMLLSPKLGRWSVSYAEHCNFNKSLWRYKEIENQKGRFFADPFVIKYNGRHIVFVEDYFFSDKRGRISAIEIKENGHEFLGVVLEENFHLSFPFVFEDSGNLYMIPETAENQQIRLYECISFPEKWVLKTILMDNVSAADTMALKQGDHWFLLTNICSSGMGDHQSELHIFYSENVTSKKWLPIGSGNPAMVDSRKARNGGVFYHEGNLYRINQIPGKGNYGKSFGVNKVCNLSIDSYNEIRVKDVHSNFKQDAISTHHFHADKHLAVIDHRRFQRLKDIMGK